MTALLEHSELDAKLNLSQFAMISLHFVHAACNIVHLAIEWCKMDHSVV